MIVSDRVNLYSGEIQVASFESRIMYGLGQFFQVQLSRLVKILGDNSEVASSNLLGPPLEFFLVVTFRTPWG